MFLAEDLNGSNVADDVHCFVRELTVEIARSTLRIADESSAPDDDDGEQRHDGQRRECERGIDEQHDCEHPSERQELRNQHREQRNERVLYAARRHR